MSYNEWIESLTDKQKETFDKHVVMYRNRSSDKILYEKYSQIYGKEFPKTFDKFQDIKYNYASQWETFKNGKQDRLNMMRFDDMSGLVGKLGNKEVRLWLSLIHIFRETYFDPDQRNAERIFTYRPKEGAEKNIQLLLSDICVSMKSSDYLNLPEMTVVDAVSYTHLDVYKRQI